MPSAALNATGRVRRRLLGAATAWAATASAAPRAPIDPLLRPATVTPRALVALMLDLAQAGDRLVAVGDRGTILLSDDAGQHWRQAACPVSVTLTAVVFATPRLGWAVGHGGAVLHSADGGSTWALQLDGRRMAAIELEAARAGGDAAALLRAERRVADGADKPLLDLHFDADGRRGLVVGAYGLALSTDDGGARWHSLAERLHNPRGHHLNAVHAAGSLLWLAGEQGLLLRSADAGRTWDRVQSPYEGSWFALASLGDDLLLVGGLRGNVWCSADHGASFTPSAVPVPVSIAAAACGAEGELLLVNQAGMLLASADRGRSFRPVPVPPGPPATSIVVLPDGMLVAATLAGTARWPRPAALAAAR